MELKSGGDVQILTRQSERGGKWSQQGKTLRLLMDPPPVRSAARRAANPQLTQSSEQIYEFSLAADNDTLTVRRTDQGQGSPPQTFQRTTADRRPHPQMERSRK
jgi:hypothetical protein